MIQKSKIDVAKISEDLLASWKPILDHLRLYYQKEISDASFCGVVAFMGIHLSLWPQWVKFGGSLINADQQTFDTNEVIAGDCPWLCLNLTYGKNTLLSHVQTEGVCLDREHMKTFLKPAFSHMFRSLNEQGVMIQYDLAVNELVKMGYTDYDVLAFTVDSDKGLPETSQFVKKQKPSTKKIPVVSFDFLDTQRDTWLRLTKQTGEVLSSISKSFSENAWIDEDVKGVYSQVAALLWRKLILAEVINPAGDTHAGFRRWMKPKQDSYRGNLLIYGDHEVFWQNYCRDFLTDGR
ncbi:hypothetical protein SDC9_110573 [bioreactor metagenome]|uniref:Uncharacterized protein n=1 Tax=bioreactor metagenome TaxID=1076179 RepID=A0A645BEC9_9ZZZZ